MKAKWIGPDEHLTVGQVGFLVQHSNAMKGWERDEVSDLPAQTNQSHEARLYGWCGSYNDTSTYACGMVKVARVARNGRAFVVPLEGAELAQALETLGYPELAPPDVSWKGET